MISVGEIATGAKKASRMIKDGRSEVRNLISEGQKHVLDRFMMKREAVAVTEECRAERAEQSRAEQPTNTRFTCQKSRLGGVVLMGIRLISTF